MGLFGGLGRIAGKAIGALKGVATSAVPGGSLVRTAVGGVSKLGMRIGRKNLKRAAIAGAIGTVGVAGIMRARHRGGAAMLPEEYRFRRRMNPGNTRAMRRAIRRVQSGAKLYGKLFGITHKHIHGAPGVHLRTKKRAA